MQPWTIWVGAFVVLLIGAVSGWVLLSTFGGGSAQDKVRLEILKLTGSIVLGSGGGVALLLAARRQRATEVDIAHKKFDATERRVTELYTAAAEQLGSDKAAVRLAGLYALERLAQYNPDHRQTIVDVICAYLRMPYTPPSRGTMSERSGGGARPRGLRRPSRNAVNPSPVRTMTALASTCNGVIDPREEQRQEFQVRMTAQRLLIEHLRPDSDRYGTPTNWKFWPDVELDLTGAVLIRWNMNNCRVASARFLDVKFCGSAIFEGVAFQGVASFGKSVFNGLANFTKSRFESFAAFGSAIFEGGAHFCDVEFGGHARFDCAKFQEDANFYSATFEGFAGFADVVFECPVQFMDAAFEGANEFDRARAKGDINHGLPLGWEWFEDEDPMKATEAWGTVVPRKDDLAVDD